MTNPAYVLAVADLADCRELRLALPSSPDKRREFDDDLVKMPVELNGCLFDFEGPQLSAGGFRSGHN